MQATMTAGNTMRITGKPIGEHPRLTLTLPTARRVQVVVFDVQGKHVRALQDEVMSEGEQSIVWDLRDDQGREAPRGVYFLKAWALGMVTRARLIVLDR